MRSFSKLLVTGALTASVLVASAPAQAATLVPFATYGQSGAFATIQWTQSGSHTGGSIQSDVTVNTGTVKKPKFVQVSGATPVVFSFLDTTQYLNGLQAKLTLTGTAPSGNPASGSVLQSDIGTSLHPGSFSFIYTGPTQSFDGHTYTKNVTNLLSGVYTLAQISGSGTSGSFHNSSNVGTLSFTSDIITNLPTAVVTDFSFSLVSIEPALGFASGKALNSFKGSATGIFSAGFVPEPATWAMIITGFGMLGLAARRRRSLGLVSA